MKTWVLFGSILCGGCAVTGEYTYRLLEVDNVKIACFPVTEPHELQLPEAMTGGKSFVCEQVQYQDYAPCILTDDDIWCQYPPGALWNTRPEMSF